LALVTVPDEHDLSEEGEVGALRGTRALRHLGTGARRGAPGFVLCYALRGGSRPVGCLRAMADAKIGPCARREKL